MSTKMLSLKYLQNKKNEVIKNIETLESRLEMVKKKQTKIELLE